MACARRYGQKHTLFYWGPYFPFHFTYLAILLVLHVICQLPQHFSSTECKPYRPYTQRLDKIKARRLQFSPESTLHTVKKCINSGTRSRRVSGETDWLAVRRQNTAWTNYSRRLFQLTKWSRTEKKIRSATQLSKKLLKTKNVDSLWRTKACPVLDSFILLKASPLYLHSHRGWAGTLPGVITNVPANWLLQKQRTNQRAVRLFISQSFHFTFKKVKLAYMIRNIHI